LKVALNVFFRKLKFSNPLKLTPRYNGNIVENGVQHHNHNLINDHLVLLIALAASANARPCLDFQKGISETSFIYLWR
jgi:hypothetical protein